MLASNYGHLFLPVRPDIQISLTDNVWRGASSKMDLQRAASRFFSQSAHNILYVLAGDAGQGDSNFAWRLFGDMRIAGSLLSRSRNWGKARRQDPQAKIG
jgi:hypothetical protein